MTILLKDDPVMQKAHESYQKFTQDDQLREMYEAREKWRKDYLTRLDDAREEGEKKGAKENALNNARKMLEKGFSLEDIADVTGLSLDEIDKLQ